MPKVLIREYDNSTTGIPASDNFAVVVPGYFGEHAGNEEDILIGHNVYELKSQAAFDTYVGKQSYLASSPEPPTLEIVDDNPPTDTAKPVWYKKSVRALNTADFDRYLVPGNKIHFYRVVAVQNAGDTRYGNLYGTTGRLRLTDNGITYVFERIDSLTDVSWSGTTIEVEDEKGNKKIANVSLNDYYCMIEEGNEGSDAIQDRHIGNQIAYELLGLGYTVLFKKIEPITKEDADGNIIEVITNNAVLNTAEFWEPLKDKSVFNFRYVMTGGYYSAAAMNQICNLANFNNRTVLEDAETYGNLSGRGDCIALCDIDENITGYEISSTLPLKKVIANIGYAAGQISSANQYSAIFGPKVTYKMSDEAVEKFGGNKEFPASFHYLACARRTFDRYNEWYAVAGYNRGVSSYSIDTTSVKLGEIAINTLAPRIANNYTTKSVNLILHERGNYYIWGNRTGYALDSKGIVFHHFLNIRQLCCSIKKQLYTACRQFTFDPNSDLLWINFVNAIKPTLEAMKADQGIKGYTISRVANDKKALLTARIRIVPIEAVEDFDISIYLEDSLTGIVVSADETQA